MSYIGYLFVFFIAGVIVTIVIETHKHKQKNHDRKNRLMQKYNDSEMVEALMSGSFWQGQTSDQLYDSLGEPESVDKKVLKTKSKQIWKYGHKGGNKFSLRITIENDSVVGWDKKD